MKLNLTASTQNTFASKKGFTLIELIVSIAIIAILAAVVIPTVTGFIFRANLSADRTEVAAINNALMAYEIDGTFTPPSSLFEARALLDTITAGTFRAQPRTHNRGYHYWFDLSQSRLVLSDIDGIIDYYAQNPADNATEQLNTSHLTPLSNRSHVDTTAISAALTTRPEGFLFTPARPVILIETSGSPLALAITSFYQVNSLKDYQDLYEAIQHRGVSPLAQAQLETLFAQSVFVTSEGMFRAHHQPAQSVLFADGVDAIGNHVIDINGHVQVLSDTAPLLDLQSDLTIPASIQTIQANALMVSNPDSPYTFLFNRSLEAIAEVVEAGFTNHHFQGQSQRYRLLNDETTGLADNVALIHRHEPLLDTPLFSQPQPVETNRIHYIFDETFITNDFRATHSQHWVSSYDGLTGRHGLLFFNHTSVDYSVIVSATLDAVDGPQNTRTTGGFGIAIETRLDDNNDDTGLIIQFDRGLGGIAIRTRQNGKESRHAIIMIDHEDDASIPESRRSSWWNETVEIRLDVRTLDADNQLKVLDITINNHVVLEGFVFESAVDPSAGNVIGLRAWTVPTLFHTLTIEQSTPIVD